VNRPPLTVVVPTRDRPDMLDRALGSIAMGLDPADELLVVDSASADAAATERVAKARGARLLRCDRPGASVARNTGWRAAGHDLVAFCDDDVWVDAGWADALAATLAADDGLGFVTGRIEVPPGQHVVGLAVSILDRPEPASYDESTPGLLGHAASMAVRRSAMTEVDGFDEMLGAGAHYGGSEENDLFDRLLAAGWRGCYEPAALAWHDQWRSRQRMIVRLDYTYGRGRGARLAKLLKARRWRRFRLVAREYLWAWGLSQLWLHVRKRDRFLTAVTIARLVGITVGFLGGLTTGVRNGHFRDGRPASAS
jgi:glycosyltransferase involved in cell wall biosynthesis